MSLKLLPNQALIEQLKKRVRFEVCNKVEILEYIKEVDRRKLYLELGYTSLFAFLTKELGYTPASAQRRIDSARLLHEIPEIKADVTY